MPKPTAARQSPGGVNLDQSVRARMLENAASLMSQQGYAGTSISAIVESVGVGPPTLYWHFKSKRGILAAVMESGAERWMKGLPEARALIGETPRERYQFACNSARAGLEKESQFLRLLIMLALERGIDDEPVRKAVRDIRKRARAWLVAVMRECWPILQHGDALKLAYAQMAFADGWMVQRDLEPSARYNPFEFMTEFIAGRAEALSQTPRSGKRTSG